MFPVIILIFILFLTALILHLYNEQDIIKLYRGGYTLPKKTDPIRNKLFFDYNKHADLILELVKNKNKVLEYVSDIKHEIVKNDDVFSLVRTSTHIGQLKLFLSELEFLTEVLDDYKQHAFVVYAGSAPSNKIYYLHTMFPNVKFILVDPNEHLILFPDGNHYESKHSGNVVYLDSKNKSNRYNVKNRMVNFYDDTVKKISKEKISINFNKYMDKDNKNELLKFIKTSDYRFYIIEDYYTNEISDMFKNTECYFISDIRSNINDMIHMLSKINKMNVTPPNVIHGEEFPSDLDTCWNNALHLNWLIRLQPKKAMLKYKVPWFLQSVEEFEYYSELEPYASAFAEARENGIDFINDYREKKHNYLDNEKIYIQAFPGIISTETRLICSDYKKIKQYETDPYDYKFYYYNWFYRQFAFIDHGYIDAALGIDGCNDCALMVKIFRDYAAKFKLPDTPKENIGQLLKTIRRTLKSDFHGRFLKPYKNVTEIIGYQTTFIMTDLYNLYKDELDVYNNT